MPRGERLIKPGNSWFSTKSIEVEHFGFYFIIGRVTNWLMGVWFSTATI